MTRFEMTREIDSSPEYAQLCDVARAVYDTIMDSGRAHDAKGRSTVILSWGLHIKPVISEFFDIENPDVVARFLSMCLQHELNHSMLCSTENMRKNRHFFVLMFAADLAYAIHDGDLAWRPPADAPFDCVRGLGPAPK